ncbi:MAG: copper resistance protein CopC [Dongiaceae bacterium]
MLRLLGAILLALAMLLDGRPATAHAVLLEMSPADGSAVPRSPDAVVLRFNEPVAPVFVRVLDERGASLGRPDDVSSSDTEVRIGLPRPLPPGTYFVSYRVVSLDSHPVGATLSFTVGDRPAAGPAPAAAAAPDWLWSVAAGSDRAIFLAALLAACGGVLFYALVGGGLAALSRPERRWLLITAALAAIAGLAGIGIEGAYLAAAPPGLPPPAAWRLGLATTLGRSLLLALAALALLLIVVARGGRSARILAGPAAIVALLSLVLTGHAATAPPRWLTAPMLGLHVLAAGFWAGSLAPLWLRLRRRSLAAMLLEVRDFSRLAVGVVGLLALAGFVVAAIQLGDLAGLTGTAYGQRLIAKLALVLLLLAAAGVNKLWLSPQLATEPLARARLRTSIAVELLLVLAILSVTASLGQSVPPRAILAGEHAHHDMAAPSGFSVLTFRDGNGALIELTPARTGRNDITVHLMTPSGPPLVPQEATLELANPGAGIEPMSYRLTAELPGLYRVAGVQIVAPGNWSLRLDVLKDEFSMISFRTELPVR